MQEEALAVGALLVVDRHLRAIACRLWRCLLGRDLLLLLLQLVEACFAIALVPLDEEPVVLCG